jgi:flavin reductase (DIM6/NTAB) family NADH-FMN oxidoreductase RutF
MAGGDELRAVMRRFPAGVAVLTVDVDGDRIGMTIGSLVSLSLEPPLVGVSIGRELAAHELIRHAGGYGVSILGATHEHVAERFAHRRPPIALWDGVPLRDGALAPLLDDAVGWLECRVVAEHPVGDHTLFVGAVEAAHVGPDEGGLAYRGGTYHGVR